MKGSDGIDTQNNGNLKDECKSLFIKHLALEYFHGAMHIKLWPNYDLCSKVSTA